MNPSRVSRILEDWSAVANSARRPGAAPRPQPVRTALPGATLGGASLVVVALALAAILLGRQDPNGVGGNEPSMSPDPSSTPALSPSAATPSETASPAPTIGPCDPANLAARITMWEGAAGHRIAHVELTNAGAAPCHLEQAARPQLVDGDGSVLIDGVSPASSAPLTVVAGGVLDTLVQDGNYCGPAPVPPVSVAFVLSDGGRFVATPLSPTDATVPPCLGASGSAGDIEMQPWAPR